jgi:hypothetical protein
MGFLFLVKLLKFKLTQLQKLKWQFRIRKTYSTLLLGFSLFEDFSKIEAIRVKTHSAEFYVYLGGSY